MGIKYEEVLQRIKEERNRFGWSQETISQKLKMTQSHYSKTESGKKRFSYQELRLLNDIGIDLDYICFPVSNHKEYEEGWSCHVCSHAPVLSY